MLETIFVLKGAEQLVAGTLGAATAMDTAANAETALAAAQAELNAAQTALLAPITAMIAETTQLAAVLVNNVAGFGAMAAAEGLATAATVTLESALLVLESPLVLIAGGLALLVAGVATASKGLSEFSKSEDQIARIAVEMKNLGNVFPTNELVDFSGRLSQLTGIDDEQIASLGAMAVQFGLTKQQAENFIPTVLDVATATHKSFEEVETAILRFTSTGNARGLLALRINPKEITGDLHDIDNVVRQLGERFGGTAEAFRHTLPGTVSALQVSVGNFFEAIGRFISPVAVPLLNLFISALDKATAVMTAIADLFPSLFPTAAALGQGGKANPLALKGDPEQTELMRQTANNTAQLDPLVKEVLGGKGIVARRSFTLRDARMTFGV